MKKRKSFRLPINLISVVQDLPLIEAGKLFKYIFSYACGENPQIENPDLKEIFESIKGDIIINN